MRFFVSVLVLVVVFASSPAFAAVLVPPVDAVASRRFEAPSTIWGPGHRGVDYAVPVGALVRAAASGTVVFAGNVAGRRAVTIAHGGGLETTYSDLSEISVEAGQSVGEGTWVGRAGEAHGGSAGLHFGVKVHDAYVDPAAYFVDVAVGDAIRLAPLVWQPPAQMPDAFRSAFADPGTHERLCRDRVPLDGPGSRAPNDNVAVAIAGIGSSTKHGLEAEMYEHGPEELGYPRHLIRRFSYAGSSRTRLHRPYETVDTFDDIERAADHLARLLRKVRRLYPGKRVDLIAHSMGGLVARHYLASIAKKDRARLPQIEHFVTFASPHRGSSLATVTDRLENRTLTGRFIVNGVSWWSNSGGPIPDPRSSAVAQMRPGSAFLEGLARESIAHGTRALALAIPNDAVVTADRASWEEARTKVVPPAGLSGHSAIVSSDAAQGLAYDFLRDAAPACRSAWDAWGPRLGKVIGVTEEQSYRGLAAIEQAAIGRWLKLGRVARKIGGRRGRVAEKVAGKLVHRIVVDRL